MESNQKKKKLYFQNIKPSNLNFENSERDKDFEKRKTITTSLSSTHQYSLSVTRLVIFQTDLSNVA